MESLPQRVFDMYALSLPRGHGFGEHPPVGAWQSADGVACGVLTQAATDQMFGILVMRRRVDCVWTVVTRHYGFSSAAVARAFLEQRLSNGEPPEPLPSGISARPPLEDLQGRTASGVFDQLRSRSHHPAAWALNELYLALPKPDRNWAADCQTGNFHTRLWEAQLLASFREQGLLVTQPHASPDFRIENRRGCAAWVEAVTANPPVPYEHRNAPLGTIPTEREELFFGAAAVRFAKTLGNKLEHYYDQLAHVAGRPFIIALADFHAPASMTWSREALVGYLYGEGARVEDVGGRQRAKTVRATHLLGETGFEAGLFADDRHAELSAVIFTNACSIAKFNRIGVSGLGAPKGFRYTRVGRFFDRTPGALEGIPFCLDVTSNEYRGLWPQGCEPWNAELEVFHNPFAKHPIPLDLLPEACHWIDEDGEKVCRSFYETSILWSYTIIQNESAPPLTLDNLQSTFKKILDA